jgi:hypothetical protein
MCHAISAAYSVDEVKDIRDKARAFEAYARLAKNTEAERQACEIRLRAERKAGQLLAQMEKAPGGQPYQSGHTTGSGSPKPLAELGISKDQSSQWQKLAAIPDDQFDDALTHPDKPTTNGILAALAAPRQTMDDRALWVWGRLQDFERMGVLDADPELLLGEMFQHMQETTRDLAPRVAAWLGELK